MNRLYFKIVFFLLISELTFAQFHKDLDYYATKYPEDDVAILKNELNVEIKTDGEEISILQTSLDEKLYLNDLASMYSKKAVAYSSFFQLQKIEAFSYDFENGKYREAKVTDFRNKNELSGSFHDDVSTVNFIFPNLKKGSKTKLYTVEKIINPRFLHAFYFGDSSPNIYSKITISVDKNIEMDFKEFNTAAVNVTFSKIEKKNKTIYTWESQNVNSYKHEEATPNYRASHPHIFPVIKKYKTDSGKTIELSTGIKDLYSWYYSLVKDINKDPVDPALKQEVDALIKDKSTEIEKVKALYYWVQKNIKYIAFEYALGGFIPRNANDIFQKKYGDCKDNSNVLNEMLKIAGIKGNLTWIGTRDIPYKYNELSNPAVDNHMILTYKNGTDYYFLDATGRYFSMDLPTPFIQGKEALIGDGLDNFEIKEVPIIPAERNSRIDTLSLSINQNKIKGFGTRHYAGYQKIELYNKLESLNSVLKSNDFYAKELTKGNNKFLIDKLTEYNKYDYDADFKVDYAFTISDYVLYAQDELYVNLNLDKVVLEYILEDNRKTDVEVSFKKSYANVFEFDLPPNYTVSYLPKNVFIENDLLSIAITYELKNNKVIYKHNLKFNFLLLKKEQQALYTESLKKAEKAYKEVLVLKKNKI